MKPTLCVALAAATLALGSGAALGQARPQSPAQPMPGHNMPGQAGTPMAQGGQMQMQMGPFHDTEMKMHQQMMSTGGRNIDVMFAQKMIVHHQGAIDMSRIQLRQGADAEAKRLAQKTIDENTKGMAELQAWLRRHGG